MHVAELVLAVLTMASNPWFLVNNVSTARDVTFPPNRWFQRNLSGVGRERREPDWLRLDSDGLTTMRSGSSRDRDRPGPRRLK